MKIESVLIMDLCPDPSNARKHSDKNLSAIKGSLKKFGQQKPIVVDSKNVVIAGNGTLEAAKALKWERIDVVRSDLKGSEAIAFALADNKTSELAEWDDDVLRKTLDALLNEGFEIEDIGFDIDDIPGLGGKAGLTDDDAVPEVPQNVHGVKLGDIWQLGNHRLMCGDSTSKEAVEKLMDGEKADLCFTSPPYNLGKFEVSGPKATNPSRKEKYLTCKDDLSESDYEHFISKIVEVYCDVSDSVMINIGLMEPNKRAVMRVINNHIDKFKETLYWKKSTSTPHIQPGIVTSLVEPIFCFGNHNSRQFKNATFKGNCNNVIEGPNASGNEYAKIHAATFPVYFPEWAIANFSKGSIIDCFMGSGTTLVACEKLGRKCYGMELDPHYCSVIIQRWQDFTGQKATKADG